MRRNEFLCGGAIVLVGYLLLFSIGGVIIHSGWYTKYSLVFMNVFLIIFYLLFLLHKLPDSFYNQDVEEKKVRILIILGILSFITSIFFILLPESCRKPVARIGTYSLVIYWILVGVHGAVNKFINDMPLVEYNKYKWFHRRGILLLAANWYLFMFIFPYRCSSLSDGKHLTKYVVDGHDTYRTKYNKERRQYQTEVHINDVHIPFAYIIYYKDYPDEIDYIDTLYVGEQEK